MQHWFHNLAEDVFLPNAELFAYLVTYGEVLVGIALLIGLFTRLTVLFGVLMSLAFLLAGTSSTNPQMLLVGLGLAAFGGAAGAYGVDRWLTPWLRDTLHQRVIRFAQTAAFTGLITIGLVLAWISTDPGVWLAAAIVAVLVSVYASKWMPWEPYSGSRSARLHCD